MHLQAMCMVWLAYPHLLPGRVSLTRESAFRTATQNICRFICITMHYAMVFVVLSLYLAMISAVSRKVLGRVYVIVLLCHSEGFGFL
jgi:hypothetical protein